MTDRILIPWKELRNQNWKIRKDGLLIAPDGRTEFPTTAPDGRVIGKHSYYLDKESVPVEIRRKS